MHLHFLSLFTTLLSIYIPLILSVPHPLNQDKFESCANGPQETRICAEIYNSTDCTGLPIVVTARVQDCHNVRAVSGGSIHVRKGSVFAGFVYDNCEDGPAVFTGPMWRTDQPDMGCQKLLLLGRKKDRGIRSWDAF